MQILIIFLLLISSNLIDCRSSYCDTHCYCDSRLLHWICRIPKSQATTTIDLDQLPFNLRKIELINIQLKQINKLIKFKNLIELKLRNVGLNELPKNFIQSNLLSLDISNNNLKKLTNTMLQIPKLEQLDLSKNQLTTVDHLFDNLISLKQLNLSFNLISKLNEFSFRNLTQLQYLNLKSNRIHQIEIGTFIQLNNLVKLILDDNLRLDHPKLDLFALRMRSLHLTSTNLTIIPQSINEHIRELYLDNNQLERLTIGDLEHLNNLRILNLEINRINEIEYDTFGRMNYLNELYLSSNHLTSFQIPEQLPKQLKILSLSDNLITELNCTKISHLFNLDKLNLSSNYIQHLDLNCFHTFINLQNLDLSKNQLTIVDELFLNLKQLRFLDLSGNELIKLSDKSFLGLQNSLKELQLSSIKQSTQLCLNKDYIFNHLNQLNLLNITSSQYLLDCIINYDELNRKQLISNYFPNLERLIAKELNLIYKLNLTKLQLNLPALLELDILNETLNCDLINLKQLINLINEDIKISFQLINLDKWICSLPKKIKNRKLTDILISDQTNYHYRKLFLDYSNNLEFKKLNKNFEYNQLTNIPKAHQLVNLKQKQQIKWSKLMSIDDQQNDNQKIDNHQFLNKLNYLIINIIFCILLISLILVLSHMIINKLQIKTKFNKLFRSYKQNKRFKHVNYSKQQDNVFIITQQCSNDSQSSSEEPLIS